ncbi:MAG: FHA domain-containing serine/threonine-protein kinase [Cyanobacteria bacterium J06639_18]
MIGNLVAGHYKVIKVLGSGGFGQTYLVEDILLSGNPRCVLKHLKPSSAESKVLETSRILFEKEADTLEKLGSHDRIPKLLDYFEEEQQFYLVQEFIPGHTLNLELPKGLRWTEGEIIEMLVEILEILEFVHSQGVIHRDLKPANLIRRSSDKKIVLIDFGAIKQIQSQTSIYRQPRVTISVGTPGYMPSEQIRRLPRSSSDIYALGMIAVQALTGLYPGELEDDPNTGEILWQHLTSVSPDLAEILTKMTRYHFKERYQKVTEVLEALRELEDFQSRNHLEKSLAASSLYELKLGWEESQAEKSCLILENQDSKQPGKIRIGRNSHECDIVLSEPTVSGVHAEIFFHSQKQQFFLRNLRQTNPPVIDGQLLLAGEIPLTEGSCVRLGKQNLKVDAITLKRFPSRPNLFPTQPEPDLSPSNIETEIEQKQEEFFSTQEEPVAKTLPPQKVSNQSKFYKPFLLPDNWLIQFLFGRIKFLTGAGGVAIASAIALLGLFRAESFERDLAKQNSISRQWYMCRVVTPTGGKFSIKLRPQPYTEVDGFKQLSEGDKVMFMQVQGDFVQVKLTDGTQGWVFWDQIQPCKRNSQ